MINQVIFNAGKTDYEKTEIFLGQARGLFDTINRQYPVQTKLYERLRGQDWTENEFQFTPCKLDFINAPEWISNRLIRNIAYQWPTDSLAASTIAGITSCVTSSTEIYTGYQRISDNESIHALTYGKIVEISFSDNARKALDRFKNDHDALTRMASVSRAFEKAFIAAHRWALFQADPNRFPLTKDEVYETYDIMFLYVVALLIMERVQFTPSFLETFAIAKANWFQPIGDAVQRIAQDELEIHVPFGAANITSMMATPRGREAYKNNKLIIAAMIAEAVKTEEEWVQLGARDGQELEHAPTQTLTDFARFSGTDVATFMGVRDLVDFQMVNTNPVFWMKERVNLAALQASPMEAPATSYMVNAVSDTSKGKKLAFKM